MRKGFPTSPISRIVIITALALCTTSRAAAQQNSSNPVFDAKGFQSDRDYFSELAFENIDTASGGLILTFTDLVLSGNAGRELRFQRTYNSKSRNWAFGLAGMVLSVADCCGSVIDPNMAPKLYTADGSEHSALLMVDPGSWTMMTDRFWRYSRSTKTLWMPDGSVSQFDTSGRLLWTRDAFQNLVTFTWNGLVLSVKQYFGTEYREVLLTFSSETSSLPASMSFQGRTWTFSGSQATAPGSVIPPWRYEYINDPQSPLNNLLNKVTTPHGGQIVYEYENIEIPTSDPPPNDRIWTQVVSRRQVVDVRGTANGTWQYTYLGWSLPPQAGVTTITAPSGATTTIRHECVCATSSNNAAAQSYPARLYLVKERTVQQGTTVLEHEVREYGYVPVPESTAFTTNALPELQERTITRGGQDYRTTYEYFPSSPNFRNFHNPDAIEEQGPAGIRRTRFEYQHSTTSLMGVPFILGLKHTERIWPNHEETGTPFQTTWDYDLSNGFLTSKTGDGFTTTFTPFEDDEANKGNVRSSRRGNDLEKTILYEYSWGRVSRIQTPFVDTTREINPDGTVHAESVIGRTTTYSYDALGRLTSVQPPGSSRAPTITDYNQNGATVTITRDSSVVTTTLDGFGRPIETVVNGVNLDIRTRTAYDAEGRKTYEGLPFKSGEGDGDVGTKFEYDGLGRVTLERMIRSVDQNSGPTRTRTYSGNVVIVRDENNHLTELTNVAYGDPDQPLLAAVRDANGNAWSYTYTHMGSLQSVVGPGATLLSPTTRLWGYNAHNQIIGEQHPESGIVSYDNYDSGGMLKEKSDQINTFEYGYDANYRLAQVLVGGQMVKGFTFEPGTDNIKTTISPEVLTTYGFEPDTGRISSRTDSVDAISFKVEYTYDARDNVSTIKYPSGRLIQYAYDSANRITSVVNPILGASGTLASNLQYHPSGGLKSYTAGNNVLTTVGYDARRYWVNSVVVAGAGGFNISYGHDGAGNVLTITDQRSNWGNQTFTYDNLDRLATAQGAYGSMTLNYDVFGNRQATNYTYDPNNPFKLTAIDNLGMTYDNNGNLKTGPQAQFDYNTSNLISRAIVGGTTTNYAYDGDDWRVKKVVGTGAPTYYIRGANGQLLSEWKNSSPAQVKDYVYAGSRLIAIYETTLAQKTQ